MITDRLKEPSTYAGLAMLASLFGASGEQAAAIAQVVTAVAGVAAVFMPERKRDDAKPSP